MDRFFVTPDALQGDTAELDRELSHRLRHVLRLRRGDRVLLVDGRGGEYEAVLEDVSSPTVRVTVVSRRRGTSPSRRPASSSTNRSSRATASIGCWRRARKSASRSSCRS